MDAGINVTINADDPGVLDYDLNHEYELLAKHHGFDVSDFEQINRNAFNASFIDVETRKQFWK
jgi:adenosine deaminase